ncbi:MAG: glycosyltransferase family 9 protein [Candidatus Zixiibacteriota bacterium]|nr:MAG: glycosyltransferase family 9 protein [candidate division Zixibacteria bacterium]
MDRFKPLEHKFKAAFFAFCRPFLKKGVKEFAPIDGRSVRRILFLRPEKIGDMAISFPVFDGLKKHFPHIELAVLASPRNQEIVRDDPRFERVYLYRKNLIKDIRELLRMRRGSYDAVVDLICDDSVTALFLSQLCVPGKPRIGVGKVKHRRYYDFNYDHRMGNHGHIIDNTLKLLTAFGIDTDTVNPYAAPYIPASAWDRADQFIRSTVPNGDRIVIGYNLSAGSSTRVLSTDKSLELLRRIYRSHESIRIILITVPGDREQGKRLRDELGLEHVYVVPPGLSLLEASALIGRLDLLISPDTSLVHIARSLGIPVVGFYSRFMKNFLLWRPYGQEVGAVVSDNDDNIHDITVDRVFEVYTQVLQRYRLVEKCRDYQ